MAGCWRVLVGSVCGELDCLWFGGSGYVMLTGFELDDGSAVKINESWLDEVKWDEKGLVPAIAQDLETGRVMMFAWMNRESLLLSMQEQRAIYWSRSRQKLWRKGEESGHVQRLHELRLDCDGDVVLLVIEQIGGIACHTGRESCFFRKLDDQGQWQITDQVLKSPDSIYQDKG